MNGRADPSGIVLSFHDACLIKGMIQRGDRQHDIAAWFGVNGGRIAEVASGRRFADAPIASSEKLPPSGPYPRAQQALAAIEALSAAKSALVAAEDIIRSNPRR